MRGKFILWIFHNGKEAFPMVIRIKKNKNPANTIYAFFEIFLKLKTKSSYQRKGHFSLLNYATAYFRIEVIT
jgi:hypothetical protein